MPQYAKEVSSLHAKTFYGIRVDPATAPPVNVDVPQVVGEGIVGEVLECSMGNWTNVPYHYAYQWLRSGANIVGSTFQQYLLVAADSGHPVSCKLTATNAAGSASVTSNAIAVA